MDTMIRTPLTGHYRELVKVFLQTQGLDWDPHIETTVLVLEDGLILATGSRHANVLKCIAVSKDREGEGLTGTVMTELVKNAHQNGHTHLFLFTKPENTTIFSSLGFHLIAQTESVAMMENRKHGIQRFVNSLASPHQKGRIGAVVVNCNPFTNGHRYLIQTAVDQCDLVHVFVLSEDRSFFPADVRMNLVKQGTADLKNILIHPTSDYLISSATFPDYFIKDKVQAKEINCALDLTVFAECFARPLNITTRFVGSEPTDLVTSSYNRQMQRILPVYGISVEEIPRYEQDGKAISASIVRALFQQGLLEEIRPLVPESTFLYLAERVQNDTF